MRITSNIVEIILGISIGVVVSISPPLINLLALILGLAIPVTTLALARGKNFGRKGLCIAAIFGTIAICRILPTKELDQKVEPFQYNRISLGQLQDSLWEKHRIYVHTYDANARERIVDFSVPSKMTKRMVLEKLARDTGLKLHLAACGTDSSILFGAHYSFTSLEP
jgi:hypothetical protein